MKKSYARLQPPEPAQLWVISSLCLPEAWWPSLKNDLEDLDDPPKLTPVLMLQSPLSFYTFLFNNLIYQVESVNPEEKMILW